MKTTFFIACIAILLTCCSNSKNDNNIYIFIPINYTGWVNLIFNDSSINAIEPLAFNRNYIYLITKNPQAFRLKGDKFPPGKYDIHYYYYNTDTTIKLIWAGYPKQNIFFERTIGSKSTNKYRSPLYSFSFFVSKEPLSVIGLSIDILPKNKILE
ncbi:MAG: hypothetical protein H7329_02770 [Opitutaceae bacterium]|nr:hypothetical protein [Cytophagales bacterium]